MLEVVLVRHAQPEWEPGGRAVDEPELSALGREQARLVADALAHREFDHVYRSPLRRAAETADAIASRIGRSSEVLPWLAEIALPKLEGQTTEQVQRFFRESRAREFEHWWDGFAGGESFRHFYERVSGGIEGLLVDHHRSRIHLDGAHRIWHPDPEARRILIVAHAGTNAVIVSHLLGLEPVPWAWVRFESSHTGLAELATTPAGAGSIWRAESFNRCDHLPEALRSR